MAFARWFLVLGQIVNQRFGNLSAQECEGRKLCEWTG